LGWQEWTDLALDIARWDVRFDGVSEEGLKQAHGDFRRGLNVEFARFIEDNYSGWVHGAEGRPLLSQDVVKAAVMPHLRKGRRVVFIIIDCMRLDQWFMLEPLLEELFDLQRDYYYSILPTATPYSRNAIFAGLLPMELYDRHPEFWDEGGPNERTRNRHERQLMDLQLEGLKVMPTK